MNKDVKIGLAIGLLLLVGLFVWLAYVSSRKPTAPSDVPGVERVAPGTTPGRPGPSARDYFPPRPVTVEVGRPPSTTEGGIPGTAELTPEALKYLELLRDTTDEPPTSSETVIPADTTMLVATPSTYVVKGGDVLSTISQEVYGTSRYWQRIAQANNITEPSRLRIGMIIHIPPLPIEERVGITPTPSAGEQIHRVEEGDTLSEISQKYYGTVRHVKDIMQANNLTDENWLRIGQVLTIPKLEVPSITVSTPTRPTAPGEYVVQEGDTLTSISQQFYGSTRFYTLIMNANGIDYPEALRPGQKLVIPAKPTGEPATPGREPSDPGLRPGERRYVVQEGDTLSEIAFSELGSSREYLRLMQRNNITDAYLLRPGQVLILPVRSSLRILSTEARER